MRNSRGLKLLALVVLAGCSASAGANELLGSQTAAVGSGPTGTSTGSPSGTTPSPPPTSTNPNPPGPGVIDDPPGGGGSADIIPMPSGATPAEAPVEPVHMECTPVPPPPGAPPDQGSTVKCVRLGGDALAYREYGFTTKVTGKHVPLKDGADDFLTASCSLASTDPQKPDPIPPAGLPGCDVPGSLGCIEPDWSFLKNFTGTVIVHPGQEPDGSPLFTIAGGDMKVDGVITTISKSPYPSPSLAQSQQKLEIKVLLPKMSDAAFANVSTSSGAPAAGFLRTMMSRLEAHERQHLCQTMFYTGMMEKVFNDPPGGVPPAGKQGFPSAGDASKASVAAFVKKIDELQKAYQLDIDRFHDGENFLRTKAGYYDVKVGTKTFKCPQLPENYETTLRFTDKVTKAVTMFSLDRCGALGGLNPTITWAD